MAAAVDVHAGLRDECRTHEAQRLGALGQRRDHVGGRQCGGERLQRRDCGEQRFDQRIVERLFARQRALLRRQRLVFERLELRRDVALGVLQRLPPPVVVGYARDVAVRDLDVEAVHAVVFDLERGDAGALAFAPLERDEKAAAFGVDRAQLVEVGVVAGGDHAAVPHVGRGLGGNRPRKQRRPRGIHCQCGLRCGKQRCRKFRQHRGDRRRRCQRVAQCRQLAGPHRLQRDARGDALDVGCRLERAGQRGACAHVGEHCRNRAVARRRVRRIAPRCGQPRAQRATAGRGDAGVDQRVQRRARVSGQRVDDLEIASRRRIEVDQRPRSDCFEPSHVRQRGTLRGRRVAQQGAGGAQGERHRIDAEGGQVARAEMTCQGARGRGVVEMPCRQCARGHARGQRPGRQRHVFREQHLGDVEAGQRRRELGDAALR